MEALQGHFNDPILIFWGYSRFENGVLENIRFTHHNIRICPDIVNTYFQELV
jgi:hypothetical protein